MRAAGVKITPAVFPRKGDQTRIFTSPINRNGVLNGYESTLGGFG